MTQATEAVRSLVKDSAEVGRLVLQACSQNIIDIFKLNIKDLPSLNEIVNETFLNVNEKEQCEAKFPNIKDFEKYLSSERPELIGDFFITILDKKPFSMDNNFIHKLITSAEDSWLQILEVEKILKSGKSHVTISTKKQKRIVKILFIPDTFTNKEATEIFHKIQMYEGICCQRVIYREHLKSGHFNMLQTLRRSIGLTERCIFIISMSHNFNMEDWMKQTLQERKVAGTKQVKIQIQLAHVLVKELQSLFKKGLIHGTLLPHKFFFCKIHNYALPLTFCVPSTKALLDKSQADNIHSLGMLMLYALSTLEKFEETENLAQVLLTNQENAQSLTTILASSAELRSLLQAMIDPNEKTRISVDDFCKLKINWEEVEHDFKHVKKCLKESDKTSRDAGTYAKLQNTQTALKVLEYMIQDFLDTAAKHFDLIAATEIFPDLPETVCNAEQLIKHLRKNRPWLIAKFAHELRNYYTSSVFKELEEVTDKIWLEQFENFKFIGIGKYGYIFTPVKNSEASNNSPQLFLLIPKMESGASKSAPFICPSANFMKMISYFQHIEKQKVTSKEIRRFEDSAFLANSTEGASGLRELVESNSIVEMWLIQLHLVGASLEDWLHDECRIVTTAFKMEVAESIIQEVQEILQNNIPLESATASDIFFNFDYNNNTKVYKTPMVFIDQTLVKPVDSSEKLDANVFYSLGITIMTLLLDGHKDKLVKVTNEIRKMSFSEFSHCFCDVCDDPILIEQLYNMTNPNVEFTAENFLSIEIEDSTRTFAPTTELHLINKLVDTEMGKQVLDMMLPDILQSGVDKTFDWKEFHASFLEYCFMTKRDARYEDLLKRNFLSFQDFLSFIQEKESIPMYSTLFKQLLYKYGLQKDEQFKKKLFQCIEELSISFIEEAEVIGHGAFGFVLKAHEKFYQASYAIKVVLPNTPKETAYIKAEIENQRNLNHPNVVFMLDYLERKLFTEFELKKLLSFKRELSPEMTESDVSSTNTDLEDDVARMILRARKGPVPGWLMEMHLCGVTLKQWLQETMEMRQNPSQQMGRMQLQIIRNLIRGLKYLQAKNIMHHDLKPDNILFSIDDFRDVSGPLDYGFPVKIADLGLSKIFPGGVDSVARNSSQRGNRRYQAPEIGPGKEYSLQAEIYSLGLIILEILTPVKDGIELDKKSEVIGKIKSIEVDSDFAKNSQTNLLKVLLKMLKPNPQKRMSCQEFQVLDLDLIQLHNSYPCHVQQKILEILQPFEL